MSENNEGDLVGRRWNRPVGVHRMGASPKVGKNWLLVISYPNENEIMAKDAVGQTHIELKTLVAKMQGVHERQWKIVSIYKTD